MPTTWPGAAPPFHVAPGYHPFVDHRYVHAGRARWLDAAGHEPNFWDRVPGPDWLTGAHQAVPHGIRLQLQPAQRTDPFIRGDQPWENWIVDSVYTLIHDERPLPPLVRSRSRRPLRPPAPPTPPRPRHLGRRPLLRRIRRRPHLAQA